MTYLASLFNLTGKTALVTGGSRGLGKEIVLGLARAGADVVIASRKLENCEAVAKEVEQTTGQRALAVGAHVGRWDEIGGLVDAAYDHFGRVDILVNNAGMSPVYDKLTDVSEQMFDSVVNLNLKGPFRLSALVGERMVADGGGSIINISSSGSIRPNATIVPYAGAKAALNTITEAMASALGPTVRVNAVLSGSMFTDVSKFWDMEAFNREIQSVALQRGGEPDEIVGAVIYLASDAGSYTTAALLRVDGGLP